jgi:autotransporter-like protein
LPLARVAVASSRTIKGLLMRRTVLLSVLTLGLAGTPALAQTCLGLASFSTGPMQVTGAGSFTQSSNTLGVGAGYGFSPRLFASADIGTSSTEAFDGSSLDLGTTLGYEVPVGSAGQLRLCPLASLGLQLGPTSSFQSGVRRSNRMAALGLAVGTAFRTGARAQIAPAAGLSYTYEESRAVNNSGSPLFEISDSYLLAQVGVGFIFNSNISVRPRVDIPLGWTGNEPTLGITVGYNFGRRN